MLPVVFLLAALTPDAAFTLGLKDSPGTPAAVHQAITSDTPSETIAAAAMGLAESAEPGTERELVELALLPARAPRTLEELARYYRNHPPAATAVTGSTDKLFRLPDARLLQYADSPSPEGRAAFCFLCQIIKDPAAVPILVRLARDPSAEVCRAAAMGLGERTIKSGGGAARIPAEHAACVAALGASLRDGDAHVRIAACRSIAGYGAVSGLAAAESIGLLRGVLGDADFNVRVAAVEGLGRCAAAPPPPQTAVRVLPPLYPLDELRKMALTDPSPSVRYTAAVVQAAMNPQFANECVGSLLDSPSEYVRSGACEILGKVGTLDAFARLGKIAEADPAIRVRETALTQFGLPAAKDCPVTKPVVDAALADPDPEIFAGACQIAQQNLWREFAPKIAAAFPNFTGCKNADARAGAVAALADLEKVDATTAPVAHARYAALAKDSNPGVRMAALTALATLDHLPPPALSRGADFSGEFYPGGKPVFGAEPFLILVTDQGTMKIRLYPDQAPITCGHVAALAMQGFYKNLTWHRVVPDFVIQGGCPRGDGSGNAGVTLPLESTRVPFTRGTLGMPRDTHPDTGGCQLFICHSRSPHLDVTYCAFGQVVEGLDVLGKIDVDSRILSARVEGVTR